MAASEGNADGLKMMLAAGADVNGACAENGRTPLMAAAAGGHEAAVGLLLEVGADSRMLDKAGATAYSLALATNKAGILAQLPEFKAIVEIEESRPFDYAHDDQEYKKAGDYVLEVTAKNGLRTIFNFWTSQVIYCMGPSASGMCVQNFREVERQGVIEEARERLVGLGGHPPVGAGGQAMHKRHIALAAAKPATP